MTRLGIPHPRLLPVTILVLAALLGMKIVGLARAIAPALAAPASLPNHPLDHATIGAAVPRLAPPAPSVSPAEAALLSDLRQRRTALDRRAAALSARQALLAAAEQRLDQRVAELKALAAKLQEAAKARAARDNAAWTGLVDLYQTMQPRQAAKIFDKLRMKVLLAVIDRMAPRRAGAILAAMQPDRAREVTDRLAALRLARDGVHHPSSGS